MATILGRAAVWQLTNSVLSEIIFPISLTAPVSKMIEMLKHVLYKLLYLNLIPSTKKKLHIPTRNPDDGIGWGETSGWEPLLKYIWARVNSVGTRRGWHQSSHRRAKESCALGLCFTAHRNASDPHSGVFWRAWSKVASAQIAGCDDKSWAPVALCHQTISYEDFRSHGRVFKLSWLNSLSSLLPKVLLTVTVVF